MPIIVNGQAIPEALIREESERVSRDLRWASIADPQERGQRIREAAEESAINRMLLEYAAATDPRPIDNTLLEREVERQKSAGGCRQAFDDTLLRRHAERYLRVGRITSELIANAAKPSAEEVEAFYQANRENFRNPDLFHAAHIVLHVNEIRTEEQARAAIEAALTELEAGRDFGEVADRYSDCKGNGGDLGTFAAGVMVQEFEDAIRALEPGQRTAIFTTPFGFHIAELRAKTPGGPADFDDVRQDIEKVMTAMHQHQELLRGMGVLRSRADIRRVPDSKTQKRAASAP